MKKTHACSDGLDSPSGQDLRSEGEAASNQEVQNTWGQFFKWLTIGLAVLLTTGALIWSVKELAAARRNQAIVILVEQQQFAQVLALEPNHIEALIGRARQRLEQSVTNIGGSIQDLDQLQKIAPGHPMWRETMVAALVARAADNARAGDLSMARNDLSRAISLDGAGPQLASARLQSPEIETAIDALGAMPDASRHASLKKVRGRLHLRRSQLAHADGAVFLATEHFQKSLAPCSIECSGSAVCDGAG